MTVTELIAALGGASKLAERLGLLRGRVAMWSTRESIPAEHHLAVWGMALEAGLSWEPPRADTIRAQLGAAAPVPKSEAA